MHLGYAVVSERKTISIPPDVFERLEMKKGNCLEFIFNSGKVYLEKVVPDGEKIKK